jgi:hypothetical protein
LNCEPIRAGIRERFLSILVDSCESGSSGRPWDQDQAGKLIARSCSSAPATDRNTEGARHAGTLRFLGRAAAQKMFAGWQVWLKMLVVGEARRRQTRRRSPPGRRAPCSRAWSRLAAALIARVANQTAARLPEPDASSHVDRRHGQHPGQLHLCRISSHRLGELGSAPAHAESELALFEDQVS